MPDDSIDNEFLHRAFNLARQGVGLASPNPYVGALIVDTKDNIAGTGTYTYEGVKHAEILALEVAGSRARGGTLYINLEPHAHQGRTPPCTDALIAAGIRRVVASMPDPNPRVGGRGFEQLRAAGIQVDVGGLQAEARRLNEAFAKYIRHGIPLVTLKSAMTLDAKIGFPPATNSNKSPGTPRGGWITGETARAHVQEQRHANDAVLVGVGTILADDPLLTDRSGKPRRRPLLRVILDSRLRIPVKSRLVQSAADKSDVLVFCALGDDRKAGDKKKDELERRGIRIERLPTSADGRPDIRAILRRLGELEVTSVMIEGGSTVNAMILTADVADKIFLYYAPRIMGDVEAVPFAVGASFNAGNQKLRVHDACLHRLGEDIAIEAYLHDPYE